MAISNILVQEELIALISQSVGDLLWKYPDGTPAVMRQKVFSGSTPPSPQYPFISVDVLQSLTPYQLNLREGFISETQFALQETRILQFTVIVHGNGEMDIEQISNELRMRLKLQRSISAMEEKANAGYYKITDTVKIDTLMSDEYSEKVQFNISYTVTDFTIDEEGGEISKVKIDTVNNKDQDGRAGLYETPDDPDPLEIVTELIESK